MVQFGAVWLCVSHPFERAFKKVQCATKAYDNQRLAFDWSDISQGQRSDGGLSFGGRRIFVPHHVHIRGFPTDTCSCASIIRRIVNIVLESISAGKEKAMDDLRCITNIISDDK